MENEMMRRVDPWKKTKPRKPRPQTVIIEDLKRELSEVKKVVARLQRDRHCKECRCTKPARAEYFRKRYLARKKSAESL